MREQDPRQAMRLYLLSLTPKTSASWIESLLSGADEASLTRFLQWHSQDSLRELFRIVPPWPPPSWRAFIHHGIPDWPAVVQGKTSYLAPAEFADLRELAWEIAGTEARPGAAAYRVFCWVAEHVTWSAVWGTATPGEIAQRRRGSSFHIAQLAAALCRALFIPARLVEEIALVPQLWRDQAEQVWKGTPSQVRHWSATRTFFHPFCEVRIDSRWQPMDAQRAQFGRTEVQQHLRVPNLLKLVVRTWEDYGRCIERTGYYTLYPLAGRHPDVLGRRLIDDLRRFRGLLAGHLEDAHAALTGQEELLEQIQSHARDLWQRQHRPRRRIFRLVSEQGPSPSVRQHVQAALEGPLSDNIPPGADDRPWMTHLIFLGADVEALMDAQQLARIEAGARALVLYDSWGAGEQWVQTLLSRFGGGLAHWISPPGSRRQVIQVSGNGCFTSLIPWPCAIDLTLARSILPPTAADGCICVDAGAPMQDSTVITTMPVGRGRLTFAPVSLAALADPYSVSPLCGYHRRLLQVLANT